MKKSTCLRLMVRLGAMQHIKLFFFENIKQDVRVVYLNVSSTGSQRKQLLRLEYQSVLNFTGNKF